jgi:hypothetical protein
LILSDINMPGMSGLECGRAAGGADRAHGWSATANSSRSSTSRLSKRRQPAARSSGRTCLPFYRKLSQQIRGGSQQLDTENPARDKPNIMVFVSHTPEIERKDLRATIAGLPLPDGKALFMLGKKMQGQVCGAARRIDLFLWIDATARTCQHLTAADAKHRATALGLFGLPERAVAG